MLMALVAITFFLLRWWPYTQKRYTKALQNWREWLLVQPPSPPPSGLGEGVVQAYQKSLFDHKTCAFLEAHACALQRIEWQARQKAQGFLLKLALPLFLATSLRLWRGTEEPLSGGFWLLTVLILGFVFYDDRLFATKLTRWNGELRHAAIHGRFHDKRHDDTLLVLWERELLTGVSTLEERLELIQFQDDKVRFGLQRRLAIKDEVLPMVELAYGLLCGLLGFP